MPDTLFRTFDTLFDKTVVLRYTRLGYTLRQSAWDEADLQVDKTGRVCLVTGATSGLGRATAEGLANLGATVHLLPGPKGSTQDRQRLWDECVRLTAPPEARVS